MVGVFTDFGVLRLIVGRLACVPVPGPPCCALPVSNIVLFFGSGLAGVGALIVTCRSMLSRNRRAGILIGQGKDAQTAMKEVGAVVEGYYAAKSAYELGKAKGIDMPITEAAYKVLYEGAYVKAAVQNLLTRQRKAESENPGWL